MNNNNQNVRQVTPEEIAQVEGLPKPLTQEELQRTQILNFKDLQKTIKFEKMTSNNKKVEERKVEPAPTVVEKSLSCVKTTLNDTDGTDKVFNVDYYFENNDLSSIIKVYKYTASANNPNGETTIKTNLDTYQKLLSSTSGYQVNVTSTDTKTLELKVQVDYHSLDLTTIPQANQENNVTKVEYKRNTDLNTVKNDMLTQGYTCE